VLDRNELAWTGGADPGLRNFPGLITVPEDSESSSVGSYSYRFGQFVLIPGDAHSLVLIHLFF
jgi:hypothetical protein